MLDADEMVRGPLASRDGEHWYLARAYPGPWIERLRDAWEVFRGRADAVRFKEAL